MPGAQLITVSVPAGDLQKAAAFYGELLGTDLARSLTEAAQSYHAQVSAGVQLTVNQATGAPMPHFSVDNLQQTRTALEQKGGTFVAGPIDLPLAPTTMEDFRQNYQKKFGGSAQIGQSMGSMLIMKDPNGNPIGLVQLAPFARTMFDRGKLNQDDHNEQQVAVSVGKKLEHGH